MKNNRGGRPRVEIDYHQLDKLCAMHCTGEECASILDINYDTLNSALKRDEHGGFSEYYTKKSALGKASLRRTQFKVAESGSAAMLIWLGKQWLGQKEPERIEPVSSSTPISISIVNPYANSAN